MSKTGTVYSAQSPCQECSERKLGCHAACASYAEYQVSVREKKAQLRAIKNESKRLSYIPLY